METAVERWNAIHKARAQQMDAAYARLGRTSADFWDRRARGYHRSTKDTVARDPFYLRLCQEITPQTTMLDVGAGTGRFTLALAPYVQHITAVEPNAAMLDYLRKDANEQGLTNISFVQKTWQDAPDELQADIVICSHVLYPILDIVPFLKKLQAATKNTCYIYMRATHIDSLMAPIWQHFHGEERYLPPGYIHAVDMLYEMGIYANVEIVKIQSSLRFSSLDGAVEEMVEQLILPDDEKTRGELRAVLKDWLVERDGMLMPPVEEMVSAMIWWRHIS
ncbi:MAG TPA: class I SAM-dependent methyltransferase [Ktedonobacteraceae bacterium]|nr:class I SAM-dependent methyltransferase [Ktedonobacteraceae bacterium]